MHATWPDRPKYFELIDGRRYAKVSPQRTHSRLQGWLWHKLEELTGDRGEVGAEWKFYLGGRPGLRNALQPDVSFVSYARLRDLTPAQREKPRFAPDVAVEIRSPDDRPGLLRRKIVRYFGKGAVLVIDVDPHKRTVTAHQPGKTTPFHEGETFRVDALAWLTFNVTDLFAAAKWRGDRSRQS
jgi:Uma2 family endonuclease